jgi:hypothetical protein
MAARLIVQLVDTGAPFPRAAAEMLEQAGVVDVRPSHPELPGVYLAVVPDATDAAALADRLRQLGVLRHVEVERFRSTL